MHTSPGSLPDTFQVRFEGRLHQAVLISMAETNGQMSLPFDDGGNKDEAETSDETNEPAPQGPGLH